MKRGCLTRFRHPFFHSYRYSGIFPTRNFRRVEKICQTDPFPFFEASRTAFPDLSDRASIRAAVTGSSAGNPPPACTSKAQAVNSGGLCVGKAEPFPQPLRRRAAGSRSGRLHDHPVRTAVRSAVQIRPTRPARPIRTCGCCRAHPSHRPSSRPCGGRRECSAPSARFIVRQWVRRRSGIRCRPAARTASASERRIRDPPRRRIRGSPCSYRTSLSEYRPVFRCNSKK